MKSTKSSKFWRPDAGWTASMTSKLNSLLIAIAKKDAEAL